jgi:ERO1-like protein beta
VQTAGYGAALKVLFEFDEGGVGSEMHLRRTEVVALVNTLGRLSDSLAAVNKFRVAVATGDEAVLGVEGWPFYAVDVDDEADSILQESSPVDDDLEDFDFTDLDDDPYTVPVNQTAHTIKEEIYSEFEAVWRAFKYVMNSWVSFPFQASAIAITEGQRLWNYWLGLPVGPRTWRIHLPGRDEL